MSMSIKALFVDIGGVLVSVNPKSREKFKTLGITGEMSGRVFKYLQTTNRTDAETNAYLAECGLTREIWDEFTHAVFDTEKRNDDLYTLLMKAKQTGIFIVYTTNNSSALKAIMEKYQIADLPDLIINSSEIGVTKPDDEFWQLAISETQKINPKIKPEEILLIDDSDLNCYSAIKNNLQSFTYKDADSTKKLGEMLA